MCCTLPLRISFFFCQAEDGIRDWSVTGVQTCALPISRIALEVNRLGFGAMRVTGEGIWDEPQDRAEALRTLQRLPALGVNLIDTADSYGPDVSEQLIHEALHPYPKGMVIATKAGLVRTGPDAWIPLGRPEYLIQQAHRSRRKLGV